MPQKKYRKAAEMIRQQGRGGDTELVHVNTQEVSLLEDYSGSQSVNPQTGLREFKKGGDSSGSGGSGNDKGGGNNSGGQKGGGNSGVGGGDLGGANSSAVGKAGGRSKGATQNKGNTRGGGQSGGRIGKGDNAYNAGPTLSEAYNDYLGRVAAAKAAEQAAQAERAAQQAAAQRAASQRAAAEKAQRAAAERAARNNTVSPQSQTDVESQPGKAPSQPGPATPEGKEKTNEGVGKATDQTGVDLNKGRRAGLVAEDERHNRLGGYDGQDGGDAEPTPVDDIQTGEVEQEVTPETKPASKARRRRGNVFMGVPGGLGNRRNLLTARL